MSENLEDQLVRVFRQKAGSITTTPEYRLAPDDVALPVQVTRWRRPSSWVSSSFALAASLALLVGLVLAWRDQARPAPPGRVVRCDLATAPEFRAAVRQGWLPEGARMLGGAPDSSVLISTEHDGATASVDLVRADGESVRLWTALPGQRVRAVANPFGAIDPAGVVFVLEPVGAGAASVVAFRPDGQFVATVPIDPGYRVTGDPRTAPMAGDGITVLETMIRQPERQKLLTYWPGFSRTPASDGVTSGVTGLLSVGGDLVTLRPRPGGGTELNFVEPQYRPLALEPAARSGYAFASDGSTLTWLTRTGTGHSLWHWAPGLATPIGRRLPAGFEPTSAWGNWAVGHLSSSSPGVVVDSATGRVASLPRGVNLVVVAGKTAVLSLPRASGIRLARVPVATLGRCT